MKRPVEVLGFVSALIVVLGPAGCARFQDQPVSAGQTSAAFQSRTLSDPGLREFLRANQLDGDWPRKAWGFEALALAAFYFQPSLEVARAQWEVARAGTAAAAERPNPTLSVTPGYNATTTVPSPWFVTPSLDIPIETAGKRGHRITQAEQLSESARLHIASVAWQVRGAVWDGLVRLKTAMTLNELLERQLELQSASVELIEAQHRAGAVSAFEVTQDRIALNRADLALHDVRQHLANARLQLAEAMGQPVGALDGIEFDFGRLESLPPEVPDAAARRQALLSRADVLGGLAEYAASQAALQLEIAKQYPDVHLHPGYDYDQGDNKWSLGLSVTLPVLHQNQAGIATATARRRESAARFEALQARAITEVERAVTGYRLALQKRTAAAGLHQHLVDQLRGVRARLEAGDISKVELTQHQLELNTARQSLLEAEAAAQTALGILESALQSPADWASSLELSPRMSQNTPP